MATIRIRFTGALQDRQDLASSDEQMLSTVYFDVELDGKVWPGQEVVVKQTAGSDFELDRGTLEVLGIPSYEGPQNYAAFRDAVEDYYRSLIGSTGSGIRITGGSTNIRMRNNMFQSEFVAEFEA